MVLVADHRCGGGCFYPVQGKFYEWWSERRKEQKGCQKDKWGGEE